ncbi:MAG: TonB-dependent receptor [Flavobacteriaceae bacterium]|nr:TonB-dependent receptor [Flavobacteriaceae bacterium]
MQNVFNPIFCIIPLMSVFSYAQEKKPQDSINKIVEQQIKEVEITANKKLIERKVDRLVFNVENSVSAAGGDAIDALKVTPGLRVQNDQISIVGKSGVSVMVDDRILQLSGDDLTNYLKSLPADNIKSIEVITTPPAKYDAEGNSGIVNIVLKKAKRNNWNASINTSLRQSKYTQESQSANLTYNKNGFSVYGNLSHSDGVAFYRTEENNIEYADKFYHSLSKIKNDYGANISSNIGLDYDFSKKFSAGVQYLGNRNNIIVDEQNDAKVYSQQNYLLQTLSDSERKRNNNSLNFHTSYKLDSLGSNITFNADYFDYEADSQRFFETKQYDDFINYIPNNDYTAENGSNQKIKNYAAQVDVEQKFKNFEISYGGKISYTENNSDINFYDLNSGTPILETDKSDVFDYTENIYAVYLSGNRKWNEHWETKIGLRLEDTKTEGFSHNLNQTNKNHYSQLFPTLYVVYKPNDNHSINFNYGKRISRPYYNSLNPFVRYINQYTTSQGNPFLQPYYIHNFELNYNYKEWTSSIYFSKSKNNYDQVNYLSNDNINSATKYENYYNELSFGIASDYTFHPFKNWESYNSADIYYKKIESRLPQTLPSFSKWSAYLETDNTYALNKNKTLFISLNYWYQFPEYYSIHEMKGRSSLDLGMRLLFLDKSLQMSIYASDIFRTLKMKNTSSFNGIINHFQNYEDRQSVRLSVKYTIGKNNFKSKNIKSSNEEEKRRAN